VARICPLIYGRSSWLKEPRSERARSTLAPASVSRVQTAGLVVGGVALLAAIFRRGLHSPEKFYQSYLFSYMLAAGAHPGLSRLLMLQHLTGGHWGIIIAAAARGRFAEYLARPPDVRAHRAWHEVALPRLARSRKTEAEPLSAYQQGYLTSAGFLGRAVLYFAIWGALVWLFNSWSREQDQNREDRALRRRLKTPGGGRASFSTCWP